MTATAGDLAPTILVQNWQSNDLKLTNVSATNDVPIWIPAFAPGIPGRTPKDLPAGTAVEVQPGDILVGDATGGWMQLVVNSSSGALGIFALIGGPKSSSGNNAYVFAVNMFQPPTPPSGYTVATTSNSATYQFNWGAVRLYVAYFGSAHMVATRTGLGAPPEPTVTLLAL